MRKQHSLIVVCVIFMAILNGNASEGQSPDDSPINIIVILDTSNRISEQRHPGQAERDIGIIQEIVTEFVKMAKRHINAAEKLGYEDRFIVVIPNQPGVPLPPQGITNSLILEDNPPPDIGWVSLKGRNGIFTDLDNQKEELFRGLQELYEFVGQHRQTGSDIWGWFEYQATTYFRPSYQNIVICISDGYLNFDRNIEQERLPRTFMRVKSLRDDPDYKERIRGNHGLLPINTDFSRYEINFLMTEIHLQANTSGAPYERDFHIITCYWETWLNSIGIKSITFGQVGYPAGQKVRNLIRER